MIVSKEEILKLIPQRNPFVLVDELIEHKENYSISTFEIKGDHYLVVDGELSVYGLMENIAQTAAARAGYQWYKLGEEAKIGFIGAISKFELNDKPKIGSAIQTKITHVSDFGNISLVKGEVLDQERIIASCELKIAINEEN
jgi:predicted hotdog family 3-hydroxylacyl-ACP dehydratase